MNSTGIQLAFNWYVATMTSLTKHYLKAYFFGVVMKLEICQNQFNLL